MAKPKPAPKSADRKKIPPTVQHGLLMEAGFKCGNPACHNVITLHLHHIVYVSEGGSDDPSNLLALCSYCHDMHHAGHITVEAVRFWKGLLLAMNQAFDRASIDLLHYLWETKGQEIWYSGDALIRFSGLIAAGLVGFTTKKLTGHHPGNTSMAGNMRVTHQGTSYDLGMVVEIHLTEKGSLFIEAWRAGDEQKYLAMVAKQSPAGGVANPIQ